MHELVPGGHAALEHACLRRNGARRGDGRLTVHDVRTTRQDGALHVSLDCVRPHGLPMTDDELSERICAILHKRCPGAVCHVTVDSSYVSTGV